MSKKCFTLNNKLVNACGLILYTKRDDDLYLLLIKNNKGKYEDIGGKVENTDIDIYSTCLREVSEETNDLINRFSLKERLIDVKKCKIIYNYKSKYLIFLIEATDQEKMLSSEMFGDIENFSKKNRTVDWISLNNFKQFAFSKNLNIRLMISNLFKSLDNYKKLL